MEPREVVELRRLTCAILAAGLLMTACTAGTPRDPKEEIIASVAASLTGALVEIQRGFEAANPGVRVRFNFGSSGGLQQQIEQGAPVDLFISAAQEPLERLVAKGLVDPGEVRPLVSNQVVLIRPASAAPAVRRWEDLSSGQVRRIALGNPGHVPAGLYGKAVLERLGLWAEVQGRLVLAEDVRQVLNFVESGEVQAGIVYQTDASTSTKVVVVAPAPPGSHPPVIYPMAVLKGSRNLARARAFAGYLLSPQGMEVLVRHGFAPAP